MPRTAHGTSAGFYRLGGSNAPRRLASAERCRIEEIVSHLIEVLDEEDGDADLEPSLGWSKTMAQGALDTHTLLHDLEEALVAV